MRIARMALLWTLVVCINMPTVLVVLYMLEIDTVPDFVARIGVILFCVGLALIVACIIFAAATHNKASQRLELQKGLWIPVMLAKVLLIPFFVIISLWVLVYILAVAATTLSVQLASAGLILGAMGAFIIPVVALVCYLVIVATSAFSVSAITIEYRKGTITLSTAVAFSILQFIPVADVISYICIAFYFRSRNKQTPQIAAPAYAYAPPAVDYYNK